MTRPYATDPWERTSTVTGTPCPTCECRIVLTRFQHDVLVLTAAGNTHAAISQRLDSSIHTVQHAVKRLRSITGASNAGHLAAIGVRAGLVPAIGPACPPGRLTSEQAQVYALLAEGYDLRKIAVVAGLSPAAVREAKHEVRQLFGPLRLPALLTMLLGLGELSRRHWCRQTMCLFARQDHSLRTGPRVAAREAAAHWAEDIALAAGWRAEHRRAREELAQTMRRIDDSLLELRAARAEAEEVLAMVRVLEAEKEAAAAAAAARSAIDTQALAHAQAATAALAGVQQVLHHAQDVNRRLTALGRRQDELGQEQQRLREGFEQQAELAAASNQAKTELPPVRAVGQRPARDPIPASSRPWNAPRPTTP
ncbi:hypothetical protein [Kitasatospora sp. NPDC005856]|uniref:hypothetical protein n=1 Tax=Kitasatospora sp. NPDC005856 TaxID=3154566 RepID=UPI0033CFBA84